MSEKDKDSKLDEMDQSQFKELQDKLIQMFKSSSKARETDIHDFYTNVITYSEYTPRMMIKSIDQFFTNEKKNKHMEKIVQMELNRKFKIPVRKISTRKIQKLLLLIRVRRRFLKTNLDRMGSDL